MNFIHLLSDWLHKVEKLLAIILCTVMLISLSAGVFYRYVLSAPLTWSDETAIFSLVWLTFIGGSMSIKQQNSAAVTIFMDRFSGKARMILLGISFLVVLLFVGYIFYQSVIWLSGPTIMMQSSNSMRMPMIFAYLSVPVSFFFLIVHSLDLIVKNFKKKEEVV
ncbi:TRAP transporter small permease [Schinkia azotoformans]|uniref:Tripartite AtP-independent periplasmic transporter subunit DctQ n=1 Tax=Schinkia azotoformans LMG 9581 TaxID=1131731 RepID=K6DI66_SCHAZ|nr:TRAP transporter small permease [Schinkia azotoformans]EKN67813.1 tripartite AtP-independent periplasmic transporter subunit DctQ [Schinkia azotoformans LMG 9581]MEC1637422.1 TRAP transporter small permease [Schinkia azotoformans]MEC1943826.1 TRAP transporter small permease [Schinkia azotoformans]